MLCARPDLSHLARWAGEEGAGEAPAAELGEAVPDVPLLQVAGAADFLLRGALEADRIFRASNPGKTHLLLGPWAHTPWNGGGWPGRAKAEYPVDRLQAAFFDHYLKGIGAAPAPCLSYEAFADLWRPSDAGALSDLRGARFSLRSGGLAAATTGDGRLCDPGAPPGDDVADRMVHDPTRPAPFSGGSSAAPFGPVERQAVDDRADVFCYTTAPFAAPVSLFGRAEAELSVQVDGPHDGLAASLSRVTGEGSVTVIATAVAAFGGPRIRLRFDAVSARLAAGDSLRLSVQAAPAPDFLRRPVSRIPAAATEVTTVVLTHEGSTLTLPILHEETPS